MPLDHHFRSSPARAACSPVANALVLCSPMGMTVRARSRGTFVTSTRPHRRALLPQDHRDHRGNRSPLGVPHPPAEARARPMRM